MSKTEISVRLERGGLVLEGKVTVIDAASLADAMATVEQVFPEAILTGADDEWSSVDLPVKPCVRCGDTDPDNRSLSDSLCGYCDHIIHKEG